MPTLDYQVNLRSRTKQLLIVEMAHFAIENGGIVDPASRAEAIEIITAFVQQLLSRKRITPDEVHALRERFGPYIMEEA